MKFIEHLTSVQGRLVTGSALAVAITVGLWPDHPRPVDPKLVGAVITAAIAWLFAELAGDRAPSAHDLKLFKEFNEALPQQELDFLHDQDFGVGSFIMPESDGVMRIAYWQGSRYEFVDKKLQSKWAVVHQSINDFAKLFALNTFVFHNEAKCKTVHPTQGDPEDPADFVQKRIDKLNDASSALYTQINEFERFARKRLRL